MELKEVQPISVKTVWPEDDKAYYEITLRIPEKAQSPETLSKLATIFALKTRPTWEMEISQVEAQTKS